MITHRFVSSFFLLQIVNKLFFLCSAMLKHNVVLLQMITEVLTSPSVLRIFLLLYCSIRFEQCLPRLEPQGKTLQIKSVRNENNDFASKP